MTDPTADFNTTDNGDAESTNFVFEVTTIAQSVSRLYEQLITLLEPEVNQLLKVNSGDVFQIERLLDQLLDVADDQRALRLYRRLCRHYFTISPTNTAIYIDAYRSMWGPSSLAEQNHEPL